MLCSPPLASLQALSDVLCEYEPGAPPAGVRGLFFSIQTLADGILTTSSIGCQSPDNDSFMYLLQRSTTSPQCMKVITYNDDGGSWCSEISQRVEAGREYIVFLTSWRAAVNGAYYFNTERSAFYYYFTQLPLAITLR